VPLHDADTFLTENLHDLLGDSERKVRVWDAGSDHSAGLAEVNEALVDLTGLLGSGEYRAGTPQRTMLNQRISQLAARQAELSTETVRPAGWVWQPTGEKFAEWWERQDTEARNIWLRSMNIRLSFDLSSGYIRWDINFGDLKKFQDELLFGPSARAAVIQLLHRSSPTQTVASPALPGSAREPDPR